MARHLNLNKPTDKKETKNTKDKKTKQKCNISKKQRTKNLMQEQSILYLEKHTESKTGKLKPKIKKYKQKDLTTSFTYHIS